MYKNDYYEIVEKCNMFRWPDKIDFILKDLKHLSHLPNTNCTKLKQRFHHILACVIYDRMRSAAITGKNLALRALYIDHDIYLCFLYIMHFAGIIHSLNIIKYIKYIIIKTKTVQRKAFFSDLDNKSCSKLHLLKTRLKCSYD